MVTILIADDTEPVRRLLRRALALLRRHQPEVTILDVVMPVLSGLQVCQLLRADPGLGSIGVVIISANADAAGAYQAGADYFLAKPLLPSEFRAAVDALVRGRALA